MTKQEMTEKFDSLYNYMASSNNLRYMKTFGYVHKEMMDWMIENKPDLAEEFLSVLCSIKWRQYLTKKEATDVVKSMKPAAPWDYPVWEKTMEELNLECEKDGVYNKYALWVAMNQIYTDFGDTLSKVFNKPIDQVQAQTLVTIVYDMAVDLLEDPDEKYNIREYHLW